MKANDLLKYMVTHHIYCVILGILPDICGFVGLFDLVKHTCQQHFENFTSDW